MIAPPRELSLPMRLLQLVSYGGIRSTAELGRRLGVSPELVKMMTEDLRRRGYLDAVSGGECETTGCTSCDIASSCKMPGAEERLPLMVLTEKGKAAARDVPGMA
jgi:DNA-binding MarR family transcriptional regulator